MDARLAAREDLCGRNQLTCMPRRVLGRMEQQAEDVRRQLRSADAAEIEQLIAGRLAQLFEGAIDVALRIANEIGKARGRIARLDFGAERRFLGVAQPLVARVSEQAIERGAEMPHVKADRRGASGPLPDVLGGNDRDELPELVACLDERVRDGHQHRIDAFDRPAHPGFRLGRGGHPTSVLASVTRMLLAYECRDL